MTRQPRTNPLANPGVYSYGSNDLKAKQIFDERKRYEALFDLFHGDTKTFSTWTTDRFYGLVNTKGNTVVPDQSRLKSLRFPGDSDQQFFALNFVSDAWSDLSLRLRKLARENIIFKDSPWANPKVFKAWQPLQDHYDLYLRNEVYPIFANSFMTSLNNDAKVRGFHTFLQRFDDFSRNIIAKTGPLTRSGMIEGYGTPNYMSGLIIEISDDDYDDDFNKGYKFLDENFDVVSNIVAQYGFMIDKNIPFRLIADISSPAMQEYMTGVPIEGFDLGQNYDYICKPAIESSEVPPMAYGYSQIPGLADVIRRIAFYTIPDGEPVPGYARYKKNAGDARIADDWVSILENETPSVIYEIMYMIDYKETWTSDIETLQKYLIYFYNFYVVSKPSVLLRSSGTHDCPPVNFSIDRKIIQPDFFEKTYGSRWKLKTFYVLRNMERQTTAAPRVAMKEVQDFLNLYNISSVEGDQTAYRRALRYLQEEYIGPLDKNPLTLDHVWDIILSS